MNEELKSLLDKADKCTQRFWDNYNRCLAENFKQNEALSNSLKAFREAMCEAIQRTSKL